MQRRTSEVTARRLAERLETLREAGVLAETRGRGSHGDGEYVP